MKKINRMMTNICSDNLVASKHFYTQLFKLNVNFDSDWFVQLMAEDGKLELGLIDRKNEMVPNDFQRLPQGFYITFVVDNADDCYAIAQAENFEVVAERADTFYGQRRLLLKDPDGTLVDISSPIAGFQF